MLRSLGWCLGLGAAATWGVATGDPTAVHLAAATAVGVAGGAASNFGYEVCQFLDRQTFGRLLDGRPGIAENHVVTQALRQAQLKALETVRQRFDTARAGDRDNRRHDEADRFSGQLAAFIAERGKPAAILAFAKGEMVAPDEQGLRQAVLDSLPDAFDQGLAARRLARDAAAIADSQRQIRRTVEAAVLAELRLALLARGEDGPTAFLALFHGIDTSDGWYDLFVRDAADRIRDAERDKGAVEKNWAAEQQAIIKAVQAAHTEMLRGIKADTERLLSGQKADTERLLSGQAAMAEQLQQLHQMVRQLVDAGATKAPPGAEARVAEAVSYIASGAEAGDERLRKALGLLQENKAAEAVPLLEAFAEDKKAKIRQDSKEAATAYRNLGTIAGLGDPKQALEAYSQAVALDPDDAESLLWLGWIKMQRGNLREAEQRFLQVLQNTRKI